jgi:hypothetical protein
VAPFMSRVVPDIVMWFYRVLIDSRDEAGRDVFCLNVRLRNNLTFEFDIWQKNIRTQK